MSVRLDDTEARALIEALDAYDGEIETLQASKRDLLAEARDRLKTLGATKGDTTVCIGAIKKAVADMRRLRSKPEAAEQVEERDALAEHYIEICSRVRGPRAARETRPATPAVLQPVAQDEGQPVRAGKASDERPVRGAGEATAGQSGEFVAATEAGEAAATADDPALEPDDQVSRESASATRSCSGHEVGIGAEPRDLGHDADRAIAGHAPELVDPQTKGATAAWTGSNHKGAPHEDPAETIVGNVARSGVTVGGDESGTAAQVSRESAEQTRQVAVGSRTEGAAALNASVADEGGVMSAQGYSVAPKAPSDLGNRTGRRNECIGRDEEGASSEPIPKLGQDFLRESASDLDHGPGVVLPSGGVSGARPSPGTGRESPGTLSEQHRAYMAALPPLDPNDRLFEIRFKARHGRDPLPEDRA